MKNKGFTKKCHAELDSASHLVSGLESGEIPNHYYGTPHRDTAGRRLQGTAAVWNDNINKRRGFTLLELLVVVLIIGILASIALPQYRRAVEKSRVATMIPLMKSIATAEEAYYLANGEYTVTATDLAVDLPATCSEVGDGNIQKCGNDFMFDFPAAKIAIFVNYCPGSNTDFATCSASRILQLRKYFEHIEGSAEAANQGKWLCVPYHGTLGQKVCASLQF